MLIVAQVKGLRLRGQALGEISNCIPMTAEESAIANARASGLSIKRLIWAGFYLGWSLH